ncbi:hypothetical protein [Brevundimonas sp.]|uniref:hypothetical protein n=1 Tax=Brevundimonas sp. TaxID=1871086 RepID=UPI00345B7DF0
MIADAAGDHEHILVGDGRQQVLDRRRDGLLTQGQDAPMQRKSGDPVQNGLAGDIDGNRRRKRCDDVAQGRDPFLRQQQGAGSSS